MYGDFSRDSFDPTKRYARVLMQQGRPLLDADWNEQVSMLIEMHRDLVRSLVGWHGTWDGGFTLGGPDGLTLAAGSYYVDGIRCVNSDDNQALKLSVLDNTKSYLAYLDVWEQTASPADDIAIIEPSLRYIDTSWRSRIQWAIRAKPLDSDNNKTPEASLAAEATARPSLQVQMIKEERDDPTCNMPRSVNMRNYQNRLYRIEIHRSGKPIAREARSADLADMEKLKGNATFKWSRSNGTSVYSIKAQDSGASPGKLEGQKVVIFNPAGFSTREDLQPGDLVEVLDRQGRSFADKLLQVSSLTATSLELSEPLSAASTDALAESRVTDEPGSYVLRRWDHSGLTLDSGNAIESQIVGKKPDERLRQGIDVADGALAVVQDVWIELDGGLNIMFPSYQTEVVKDGAYKAGDYWLIRTNTDGSVVVYGEKAPPVSAVANRAAHSLSAIPLGLAGAVGSAVAGAVGSVAADVSSRAPAPPSFLATRPHRYAPFGIVGKNSSNNLAVTPKYNNVHTRIPNPYAVPPEKQDESPAAPTNGPTPPVPPETPASPAPPAPMHSLLSPAGKQGLKRVLYSSDDVVRRVLAVDLNYEPKTELYRRFRVPLFLSDIAAPTFEQYFAKVERCLPLIDPDRELVREDARNDYVMAMEFQRVVSAGGARSLIT